MEPHDVEIIRRKRVYDGYLKVDQVTLRHRRHEGGWTGEVSREAIDRGHAVAVLPYDRAADRVVLIEQFRIGAYDAGVSPWQIEIIAGIIEPGEAAEEVARREALEEAGCALGPMVPVFKFLASPGVMSETAMIYCAAAESDGIGGVYGLEEEQEDIRAFTLPLEEAIEMVDQGRIQNAPAVIALQWLARNRDRIAFD